MHANHTIALLVLFVAVGGGAVADGQVTSETAIVTRLTRLPGVRLGWDESNRIESVQLFDRDATDALVSQLRYLPKLRALGVTPASPSQVTDQGVLQLRGLDLRHLSLVGTSVTDASMPVIGDMTNLQGLVLRKPITSDGVRHLKNLEDLEFLDLSTTSVTDEVFVEVVPHLAHLKQLILRQTDVTNAGFANLLTGPKLELIRVDGTAVDEGVFAMLHASLNDDLSDLSRPTFANLSDLMLEEGTRLSSPGVRDLVKLLGVSNLTLASLKSDGRLDLSRLDELEFRGLENANTFVQEMRQAHAFVEYEEFTPVSVAFIRDPGSIVDEATLSKLPPSVRALSFYGTSVKGELLKALYRLGELEVINVAATSLGEQEDDFLYLANLLSLTKLRIPNVLWLDDTKPDYQKLKNAELVVDAFREMGAHVFFGDEMNHNANRLDVIGLDFHRAPSVVELKSVPLRMRALGVDATTVNELGIHGATDDLIEEFPSLFPKVISLYVSGKGVTRTGLEVIAKNNNLRRVDLDDVSLATTDVDADRVFLPFKDSKIQQIKVNDPGHVIMPRTIVATVDEPSTQSHVILVEIYAQLQAELDIQYENLPKIPRGAGNAAVLVPFAVSPVTRWRACPKHPEITVSQPPPAKREPFVLPKSP